MNKIGKLRRDINGHWYFLPISIISSFENDSSNISIKEMNRKEYKDIESLYCKFEMAYGHYRIDSPESFTFILEEKE